MIKSIPSIDVDLLYQVSKDSIVMSNFCRPRQ
jgi:hypothetical protein